MALVMRIRDKDSIQVTLEDGRTINICINITSRLKAVAFVDAEKTIQVTRVKAKEEDEQRRNPS